MSDAFERAKAGRNWLERLGEKIPGYAGFQDRELRRDVDKTLREQLARQVESAKRALREKARALTDLGQLAALTPYERIERRLDGLAQAIRYADYGASGLFDAIKIGEAELERLYEFDSSLVDAVAELGAGVAAMPPPPPPGPNLEDPAAPATALANQVAELETRWAQRESVITNLVAPSDSASL